MLPISFKDFQTLCELNLQKRYMAECLDIVINSDCLFHPGNIMPRERISDLYQTRLKIAQSQKELTRDYLQDFEQVVLNLTNSSSKDLALSSLYSDQNDYIVFYEPEKKFVLGVLKFNRGNSLQATEEYATSIVEKGLSAGFKKYSKGVYVKSWD